MVCFTLFASFALFAVHGIQSECPLYFNREIRETANKKGSVLYNFNRETRESREQKTECPL